MNLIGLPVTCRTDNAAPPRDFDRTPELKGAYKPPAVQARAPDNAMRTMPRPADECIRRFLQPVLPQGCHNVRA